jgi:NTE family protein
MVETDLVLSSGFLAFARQAGFLAAVERSGVKVTGVCGTSSGALASSLWLSGLSAEQVAYELSVRLPFRYLRPSPTPWRGACSLQALVRHLRNFLPPTFADLPVPFGIGTMTPDGQPLLLTEGPLAEAVVASCSIPGIFSPTPVAGRLLQDGGVVDRLFLDAWLAHRGNPRALVHIVDRSQGAEAESEALARLPVVRTPRSRARFWNLGDFRAQLDEARALAAPVLAGLR